MVPIEVRDVEVRVGGQLCVPCDKYEVKQPRNEVRIGNIVIKHDTEGRYCLNDVHKAGGEEERHSPNRWTHSEEYEGLINELTPELAFAPAVSIRGGSPPGTYVCEELGLRLCHVDQCCFQAEGDRCV